MAHVSFKQTTSTKVPLNAANHLPFVEGQLIFVTDTRKLMYDYIDGNSAQSRIPLGGEELIAGLGIDITNGTISLDQPIFIGTTQEWTNEQNKSQYVQVILTDDSTSDAPLQGGNGISISDNKINVTAPYRPIFIGTQSDWEALSDSDKAMYQLVSITDDNGSIAPISSRNLLDNSYFIGGGTGYGVFPVNQRGDTTGYVGTKYGIDRWWMSAAGGTVTPKVDGLEISYAGTNCAFFQFFMDGVIIPGNQYTGSLLFSNGTLLTGTAVASNDGSYTEFARNANIAFGIRKFTKDNVTRWSFVFANITTGTIKVVAAKLELGSQQTLVRKVGNNWVLNDPPPDYGEELAKCQRYLHIIKAYDVRNLMIGNANANDVGSVYWDMTIPMMVKAPSLTVAANKIGIGPAGFTLNPTTVSLYHYSAGHAVIGATGFSGLTVGQPYRIGLLSGGTMIFSVE